MKYFQTLPSVINVDSNNNLYVLKNLMARAALLPELSRNPMLMYQYTIQDGDTPESIAHKYYNDQYRYWIILLGNNIIDPQWNWPLTPVQFDKYVLDKYKQQAAEYYGIPIGTITDSQIFAYVNGTAHHYEEIITTTDNSTTTKSQKTLQIDEETYNTLGESTQTYILPNGESVTREIQKRAVSLYDYEFETNEEKRNINIIQSRYVNDVEDALKSVMG